MAKGKGFWGCRVLAGFADYFHHPCVMRAVRNQMPEARVVYVITTVRQSDGRAPQTGSAPSGRCQTPPRAGMRAPRGQMDGGRSTHH